MGWKIRQRPSPDPSPNSTSEQRAVQCFVPALVHSRDSKPLPTGATASYEKLARFVATGPALPCLL